MACAILRRHFEEIGQNTRVICLHPGWLRTSMGGPEAFKNPDRSVSPEDSAAGIIGIAMDIENIPADQNYMDYKRELYTW